MQKVKLSLSICRFEVLDYDQRLTQPTAITR